MYRTKGILRIQGDTGEIWIKGILRIQGDTGLHKIQRCIQRIYRIKRKKDTGDITDATRYFSFYIIIRFYPVSEQNVQKILFFWTRN